VSLATDSFDLGEIGIVDNHCHPLEREQGHRDVETWRRYFTESEDSGPGNHVVSETAYYRRLVRAMAEDYDVAPDESSVLAARAAMSTPALVQRLFADASISGVVVDLGYPSPELSLAGVEFVAATNTDYGALLRVELLFQQRVRELSTLHEVQEKIRDDLKDLRAAGYVGLKSIVGYRTGLAVERWSDDDVAKSFAEARREVDATGSVRLGHKPLLDSLLHLALAQAARDELPVQFHVGYGDHDVDLRTASPLLLRPLMEDPQYASLPIVLLHGCWPYFREGAFLASIYPKVFLDVSFGIPFLGAVELRTITKAVFATAPFSKLMYSSDGARVPEIFWLSAFDGRRILSSVLGEMVGEGDLEASNVHHVAEMFLATNARRLYGLGSNR
ncbi:MAG TPA: amidohydrolase family protein, partial [Acidimicrobiales bacterium]|nr:amidohydrolase family protein [Acidimicrobiales bacterium]